MGIATATHPARLGCKNNVKIKRTRIKPITPFLVNKAILCSITTELSIIMSAFTFLLISLKFSRYALVLLATILISSLFVLNTLITTPGTSL